MIEVGGVDEIENVGVMLYQLNNNSNNLKHGGTGGNHQHNRRSKDKEVVKQPLNRHQFMALLIMEEIMIRIIMM
jgi:hypothetical protein